ncbi:MAG: hypothetical protein ACI814_000404 [Mariniblastus sp.]|jgi:hypothetical protein
MSHVTNPIPKCLLATKTRPRDFVLIVLAIVVFAFEPNNLVFSQDVELTNQFSPRDSVIRASEGRVEDNISGKSKNGILVGLPTALSTADGQLIVNPNTVVAPDEGGQLPDDESAFETRQSAIFSGRGQAPLLLSPSTYSNAPDARGLATDVTEQEFFGSGAGSRKRGRFHDPIFQHIVHEQQPIRSLFERLRQKLFGCDYSTGGVGRERIAYSLFMIDLPPSSNTRLRFNSRYNQQRFYNGQTLIGNFDSQEMRLQMEAGGAKFSVTTELPYVAYSPDIPSMDSGSNTSGFGDTSITTKTVLKDGDNLQVTQIFRSFIPSGNPGRNLGRGHASFETGVAMRRKFRPQTEFQGELLYYWPAGSAVATQMLKWGVGAAHVWHDSDDFAILPTLELTGWSVLDAKTDVSGFHSIMLTPGCRFVFDKSGDLGLFDAGISVNIPVSQDHWHDGALSLEFRWSY